MLYKFTACILSLFVLLIGSAANVSAQDEISVQVLASINRERSEAGLPGLTRNAQLDAAAQAHADDLSKNGVNLGHRGSDGSTIKQRIARAGYGGEMTGENWAAYRTLDQIMNFWLNDPPHKRNILHTKFREIGIGVARRANGGLIVITDFGAQAGAPEIAGAAAPVRNTPQKPRAASIPVRRAATKPARAPALKPTAKPTQTPKKAASAAPTPEQARVALANVQEKRDTVPQELHARGRVSKNAVRAIGAGSAGTANLAGDPLRMALGAVLAAGGMILLGVATVGHWRFRMR